MGNELSCGGNELSCGGAPAALASECSKCHCSLGRPEDADILPFPTAEDEVGLDSSRAERSRDSSPGPRLKQVFAPPHQAALVQPAYEFPHQQRLFMTQPGLRESASEASERSGGGESRRAGVVTDRSDQAIADFNKKANAGQEPRGGDNKVTAGSYLYDDHMTAAPARPASKLQSKLQSNLEDPATFQFALGTGIPSEFPNSPKRGRSSLKKQT